MGELLKFSVRVQDKLDGSLEARVMLESVADGIWVARAPLTFLGLHLGARMTIVRLEGGGLLIHSPILVDPALKAEIDRLGKVTHIVCPNHFHHLYAGDAKRMWPDALLHGPEKLQQKRKDLTFDGVFNERLIHPDWAGLKLLSIGGCMLNETVVLHEGSGTLITCDLMENFTTSPHFLTRCYLKVGGVYGKPGWSKLGRWMYRDRKLARSDFERLLTFDFDRIILAHGEIIDTQGPQKIREGMDWLLQSR